MYFSGRIIICDENIIDISKISKNIVSYQDILYSCLFNILKLHFREDLRSVGSHCESCFLNIKAILEIKVILFENGMRDVNEFIY